MKFGIVIPTIGNSAARLDRAIESINRFTDGIDYSILVSDDATPNEGDVEDQKFACDYWNVEYRRCPKWRYCSGNFHDAGMAVADDCDVIVFFADDLMASRRWLEPIAYFYENNPDLNVGMVSGVMIESWELAMNQIIDEESTAAFYKRGCRHEQGLVMREDLEYGWHIYRKAFVMGRVVIKIPRTQRACGVIGVSDEGTYNFPHPSPMDGGLGPCFSIRSDVFKEVNGFGDFPFEGDFECCIGWRTYEEGLVCAMVPSPPVYHDRGAGSGEREAFYPVTMEERRLRMVNPWNEKSLAMFQSLWPPHQSFAEAQNYYKDEYVDPAAERINAAKFMPYEEWKP